MRFQRLVAVCLGIGVAVGVPARGSAQPRPDATRSTLNVRVVQVTDGAPVDGGLIRLRATFRGTNQPLVASTTGDGTYRFQSLQPDLYSVTIEPPRGFVAVQSLEEVVLFPGESREIVFALDRTGVINGRVVDERGNGVFHVPVQAIARGELGHLTGERRRTVTDDRGQFRLSGLAPGDYLLLAIPSRETRRPLLPPARAGYADTYYPNVTTIDQAAWVTVRPQEESSTRELTLAPTSLSSVVVSVRGSGGSLGSVPAWVSLKRLGEPYMSFTHRREQVDATGVALFDNVTPGDYYVVAQIGLRDEEIGYSKISVNAAEVAVAVRTNKGAILSGRMVFEGLPANGVVHRPPSGEIAAEHWLSPDTSGLQFMEFRGQRQATGMNDSGLFSLAGLRGPIRFTAWGDGALASIRRGPQDITSAPLELEGTDVIDDIVVTFRLDVASVEVTVASDAPPSRPERASLVVFPQDRTLWLPHRIHQTSGYVSVGGHLGSDSVHSILPKPAVYQLGKIIPGRYLVAAVRNASWIDAKDTEMLERIRSLATPVTLTSDETARVAIAVVDVGAKREAPQGMSGGVSGGSSSHPPRRSLVQTESLSQGTSSLAIRIEASGNGAPVRGAYVQLAGPILRPGNTESRVALTDSEGTHTLRDLPAGAYSVTLEAPVGFVQRPQNQYLVLLPGTEHGVTYTAERTGAINGIVVNQDGESVPGIEVQALLQSRLNEPIRTFAPRTRTDDRGQFRLFHLPPGDYVILVSPWRGSWDPTRPPPRAGYADTFYPGVQTALEARAVTVVADGDGPILRIPVSSVPLVRLEVTARDAFGLPLQSDANVALDSLSAFRATISSRTERPGAGGVAVFEGIAPGDYRVVVSMPNREETGFATVKVEGTDVALTVRTNKGSTLIGRIEFEGPPPDSSATRNSPVHISAFPPPGTHGHSYIDPSSTRVTEAGTFALMGLRGPVALRASASGRTLVSIRRGTEDITDRSLTLEGTEVMNDIVVTFTTDVSSLEATLASTSPPERPEMVTLAVFPADPARWIPRLVHFTSAYISRSGRVRPMQEPNAPVQYDPATLTLTRILPGRYLAVAVRGYERAPGELTADLERLRAAATPIDLAAGQMASVSLSVVDGSR